MFKHVSSYFFSFDPHLTTQPIRCMCLIKKSNQITHAYSTSISKKKKLRACLHIIHQTPTQRGAKPSNIILVGGRSHINQGWLRANVDYMWRSALVGQEFMPKTKLFEATVKMVGKVEKQKRRSLKSEFLRRSHFLSESLRLPKELDLRRPPLNKKMFVTLASMLIFHPCSKFIHRNSLGCSVKHGWWRTHSIANHTTPFP